MGRMHARLRAGTGGSNNEYCSLPVPHVTRYVCDRLKIYRLCAGMFVTG